jgi:hypothetical protein
MNKAPQNSQTAASIIAILIVTAPDPTEVANAFATSFAPIPNAVKKHKNAPRTTTVVIFIINFYYYLEEENHCQYKSRSSKLVPLCVSVCGCSQSQTAYKIFKKEYFF